WAAFSGGDALPWNDFAFVRLIGAGGVIELFGSDIAAVGDFGHTPWAQFSAVIAAGDYTFEAGISNGTDEYDPSFLILDGITLAEVPEPGTWALMLMGFLGLGAAMRGHRAAAQSVRTPLSNA
ncbi:MAG: PEPxxWA-CTERM sorting domain-containing protein, partial [Phenylobacterium sp.]|nr:PEPxxWA-CTERM sorting domain-containing protein [Phenylobacterium sp.]